MGREESLRGGNGGEEAEHDTGQSDLWVEGEMWARVSRFEGKAVIASLLAQDA